MFSDRRPTDPPRRTARREPILVARPELEGDVSLVNLLAAAQFEAGNLERARELGALTIELAPGEPVIHFNMGKYHLPAEPALAHAYWQQALFLDSAVNGASGTTHALVSRSLAEFEEARAADDR